MTLLKLKWLGWDQFTLPWFQEQAGDPGLANQSLLSLSLIEICSETGIWASILEIWLAPLRKRFVLFVGVAKR